MNEKEVGELRRRLRPEKNSITHIRGCYVNEMGESVAQFDQSLALMTQEETETLLALLRRTLSGTLGKNLLDLSFETRQVVEGEEHRRLMRLRDTALKDEEAVEEFSGTLLFVSHDRYFIDRFANRIWTLEGGKIQDFRGDYTAYQAYRERQKALTPPPKKEEKAKKEKPKRSGGTKQLKKELAAAEKRMEKLDQLLEALNVQKEAAASDYQKLQELLQQEAAYNAEYDALMETWETLSEAIAAEEGT